MDEEDRQKRQGGPTFDPPVYKQRYNFVENIVRKFGAKKVQHIPDRWTPSCICLFTICAMAKIISFSFIEFWAAITSSFSLAT